MAEHVLGAAGCPGGPLGAAPDPRERCQPALDLDRAQRVADSPRGLSKGRSSRLELTCPPRLGIALRRAQLGGEGPEGRTTTLDGTSQLGLAGRDRLRACAQALVSCA